MPLPEGTVTFLFTGIEASTRLWEAYPEAMRTALARHDALLRQAIETHGGRVFKTVGDQFCAVFGSAPAAAVAALTAQRALLAEEWPLAEEQPQGVVSGEWSVVEPPNTAHHSPLTTPGGGARAALRLRVRIALHTGEAELRQHDYFGPALNRVARLLETGHGGQILLSHAAYSLVRDHLAADVEVQDLGEHRLKDLARPERIFQLTSPDLPDQFPPLAVLDTRRHNLPVQRTPLIGREREVAAVSELLRRDEVALVTLTGPSGTGKTRLGLQVAAELVDTFADGVFFVPLAAVTDANRVASAIAQALEIQETPGRALPETLQEHLRDRHLLLLLDNFEQVLEARSLLVELLSACPRLKVLVTSRAVLRVQVEKEFPVPPLSLPDPRRLLSPHSLSQYAAVALFIQRAAEVKPDFAVTSENAPAVAEICHRLDGLPLAIELAAARIRLLPPQAMLSRLESRLRLLTGGARDLPARQQTLRGAIGWSYDLLEEDEKALFRRLCVFVGGCTLEEAESVCNPDGALGMDLLERLESLVDKSLLQLAQQGSGEPRFTMLETIREYGLECLEASGEAEPHRERHARFFLSLVVSRPGRARLEVEHDNVRVAMSWLVAHQTVEEAVQLGTELFTFWMDRGFWTEGQERLSALLELLEPERHPVYRTRLLRYVARFLWRQGDVLAARAMLEESLAIHRRRGDQDHLPACLNALGDIARELGDHDRARSLFEESLAILRERGTLSEIAWALHGLGEVAYEQGEAAARAYLEESLKLFQEAGARQGIAFALCSLGEVAHAAGDLNAARSLHHESLTVRREVGHKGGIATSTCHLGTVAVERREFEEARAHFQESLAIRVELGDPRAIIACLEQIARLAALEGQAERAARLLGAAGALRRSLHAPLPPVERADLDHCAATVRSALSPAAFDHAWSEGEAMSLAEAVAAAGLVDG